MRTKKISKVVAIFLCVILAIGALALATGLIKVRAINEFGEIQRAALIVSNEGNEHFDDGEGGVSKNLIEAFDKSGFSVLHAWLELKCTEKMLLKKDSDGEPTTVTAVRINSYGAFEGERIVRLYFKEASKITVEGKEIAYDRVLLRLKESNGEIIDVECIPYLSSNVNNDSTSDEYDEDGNIGSENYTAYVLNVRMVTSELMNTIAKIEG